MKKHPDDDHPGDGRRLGHRHQRAHQRHDRHLRGVARHEGRGEEAARRQGRRAAGRDPRRQGRPVGLRERLQPAQRADDGPAEGRSSPARSTNWKEVGGPDAKIIPYSRENSSGTYVFFKEHVLQNADYTPRAQAMPGTAAVVNAVSKEKFGIGYGGAAYAKGIKVLKVKKDAGSAGHRARRRDDQERHLPAVAPAVLLRAHQALGRHQGVHRLGAVAARGRRSSPRSDTSPSNSVKKRPGAELVPALFRRRHEFEATRSRWPPTLGP